MRAVLFLCLIHLGHAAQAVNLDRSEEMKNQIKSFRFYTNDSGEECLRFVFGPYVHDVDSRLGKLKGLFRTTRMQEYCENQRFYLENRGSWLPVILTELSVDNGPVMVRVQEEDGTNLEWLPIESLWVESLLNALEGLASQFHPSNIGTYTLSSWAGIGSSKKTGRLGDRIFRNPFEQKAFIGVSDCKDATEANWLEIDYFAPNNDEALKNFFRLTSDPSEECAGSD